MESKNPLVAKWVDSLAPNETEYQAIQSFIGEFDGVLVRKQGADDVIVEAE